MPLDLLERVLSSYTLLPLSDEKDHSEGSRGWWLEVGERVEQLTGLPKASLRYNAETVIATINEAAAINAAEMKNMKLLHCSTVVLTLQALTSYNPRVRLWVSLAAYTAAQTLRHALQARSQHLPGLKELAETLENEALRISGRHMEPRSRLMSHGTYFYERLAEAAWGVVKAEQDFADSLGAVLLKPRSIKARLLYKNIGEAYDRLVKLIENNCERARGKSFINPYARIKCRIRLDKLKSYARTCKRLHYQLVRLVEALSHGDTLKAAVTADQLVSQGYSFLTPQLRRLVERIHHVEATAMEYALIAALTAQGYAPIPRHRGKKTRREEIDFLGCKPGDLYMCTEALILEAKLTLKQDPYMVAAKTLKKLQSLGTIAPKLEKLRLIIAWLKARSELPKLQSLALKCNNPVQHNDIGHDQEESKNKEELLEAANKLCKLHTLKEITIEFTHAYNLVSGYCKEAMVLKIDDCNKWRHYKVHS